MVDPEPLDGELALASHWVVMTEGLIPCRVCKEEVAESASVCPKCGASWPVPALAPGFSWTRVAVAVALVAVVITLVAFVISLG